jgi:hypothetical protein
MRADATLRPAKPPRGLILSTGEDVPRGQSLRARLFTLELAPGELNWTLLTACQRDAAAGRYAAGLAGYLRWLASRYAAVRDGLRAEVAALRDRVHAQGLHARTPGIVADLAVGWDHWLAFALEAGAIDQAQREALARRVWTALQEAGAAQAEHVAAAEPCEHFRRLLAGAVASGRAYVAGPDGQAPENAEAWGWLLVTIGAGDHTRDDWQPQGRRVGWIDGSDLYLEPEAAYAEAQELARHQGDSLPIAVRTLWRRLRERGLLASWDTTRQRNTVRRTLAGVKDRDVLHLSVDALSTCARPSGPSAAGAGPGETPENRTAPADGPADGAPSITAGPSAEPSERTIHKNGQKPAAETGSGRSGRSNSGEDGAAGANQNQQQEWGSWQ